MIYVSWASFRTKGQPFFSFTLCVLLPRGETVSQHSTRKRNRRRKKKERKEKHNKKMEHLKKASNHRGQPGPAPPKNRAWWEKAAKWHRISPEDSVWTFFMPFCFFSPFDSSMNVCPVSFKGKTKKKSSLFESPKHWIVLVLYIFILIYFLYPGLSLVRAYRRKFGGTETSCIASWSANQHTCHGDSTVLTQMLILWHWRSIWQWMHQKNLKREKEKQKKGKKNYLNYELNAFGRKKKLREYCNKLRTEFSLLIVSC